MSTTTNPDAAGTERKSQRRFDEEFDVGRDLNVVRESLGGELGVQFSSDDGWLRMDAETVEAFSDPDALEPRPNAGGTDYDREFDVGLDLKAIEKTDGDETRIVFSSPKGWLAITADAVETFDVVGELA